MKAARFVLIASSFAIGGAARAEFVSPPLAPPAVNGPNRTGPAKVALPPADRSASCNDGCLRGIAVGYLKALVSRDFSGLQVAPNLIVVENGQATRIGDNLWRVIEGMAPSATLFTDPVQGQVIALTTVEESAHQPLMLMVRLKVEERRIAEVETMLTSDIDAGQHFRPDNVANFDPDVLAVVPVEQRMGRDELQAAEDAWWYEGGKGLSAAPDCHRAENADMPKEISRCNPGARRSANSPSYANRAIRQPVIDVERGLVVTYLLSDSTPYLNPDPPDAERTPLFYRQPLTANKVTIHKFTRGGVLHADHNFMNYQVAGLRAYFPR